MCPSLDLVFTRDGLFFRRLEFRMHKDDRPAAGCPQRASTVLVSLHALVEIESVTDVKTVVGAAKNVDDKGIC